MPVAAIPAFIEKATAAVMAKFPGARPVTFGHLGDGNLHFNFNAPPGNDDAFLAEWDEMQLTVHDIVKEFGGSISAEHGIGTMKRDLLPRYKIQRGTGRHARPQARLRSEEYSQSGQRRAGRVKRL